MQMEMNIEVNSEMMKNVDKKYGNVMMEANIMVFGKKVFVRSILISKLIIHNEWYKALIFIKLGKI